MDFAEIILSPFVWLLKFFYTISGSYGIALILFAIVVKLILFPFSLKGKRSMIQMNILSEKVQKLQKQYGRDKERYNLEVQKLYEKEKVNPMGGCLWSFLPLLILLPLYAIIRQPLKYMMGVNTQEALNAVAAAVNWSSTALDMNWIKEAVDGFSNVGYNQLYLASLITPENLSAVQAAVGEAGSQIFSINFDFLGLVDLSQIPQLKFWTIAGGFGLFLLPVVSAVSGFLFSLLSMKTNAVNQQSAQASNSTAKSMLIVSPLMSLWIGFAMPAALCVYWIANNLLSLVQEVVSGKLLKKDYEKAAALKAEQERQEKEEEKERRRQAAEERARRIEEEKNNKGKKKKAEKKPDEDESKIPGSVKEASRVGMRQYARGRAYDPCRYSPDGPTPYGGAARPAQPVKQPAPEEVKAAEPETAVPEAAADPVIVAPEETAVQPGEAVTPAPALETPQYDAPSYDGEEAEAPYAEEAEEPEEKN